MVTTTVAAFGEDGTEYGTCTFGLRVELGSGSEEDGYVNSWVSIRRLSYQIQRMFLVFFRFLLP